MSIVFLTFGSHDHYISAGKRLIEQAKKLNIFTKCILYTSEDLKNDKEFWKQHSSFILNNPRGYGYWLWKPYLIKKTIQNMNKGDILLYLDSGCELTCNRKNELLKCINIVKTDHIIGTLAKTERKWNKMDLLIKLDMNKDIYLNTGQRQAGTNMFLVCDETINLVNEWYAIGCEYHYIDDSPSIIPNGKFIEHRHDQSIMSLLYKYMEGDLIINDETWFGGDHGNFNTSLSYKYPFWATRFRS
jgi:hypothetical protein